MNFHLGFMSSSSNETVKGLGIEELSLAGTCVPSFLTVHGFSVIKESSAKGVLVPPLMPHGGEWDQFVSGDLQQQ